MAITTKCSLCGLRSEAPDEALGKMGRCSACGTVDPIAPMKPEPPPPVAKISTITMLNVPLNYAPKQRKSEKIEKAQAPFVVPTLLYIYATFYQVIGGLGLIICTGLAMYVLSQPGSAQFALIMLSLVALKLLIVYRLGSGLKLGERASVYALCFFASLAILGGIASIFRFPEPAIGCIEVIVATAVYLVPLSSVYDHWKEFR